MYSPFQIGSKSDHIFAEESRFFDGFGQADVVIALAVFAPIHQLLILGNEYGFFDECDLLKSFCFTVNEVELLLAVGTIGEFEFNDCLTRQKENRLFLSVRFDGKA